MSRTKKYLTAASVVAALAVGVPGVAYAVSGADGHAGQGAPATHAAHAAVAHRAAARPVVVPQGIPAAQVVAPGQRVRAGHGLTVWLTKDGKYAKTPGDSALFTPKVDGGQTSGVNMQAQQTPRGWFVTGTYVGHGRVGRVEVTTAKGVVLGGHALQLAGDPGWGAFFVVPSAALPCDSVDRQHLHVGVTKVVVYDTADHVITSTTYPPTS
jgi:hypothetical protein